MIIKNILLRIIFGWNLAVNYLEIWAHFISHSFSGWTTSLSHLIMSLILNTDNAKCLNRIMNKPVVYISAEQRPNSIITWIDWILPKCRGKIYNENFCTCYFCLGEEGASVCSVMIQSGITFGTVETKSLVSTLLLPSIIQMRLFISPHPAGGIPKPKCLLLKLLMCSVQFWKLAWILLET